MFKQPKFDLSVIVASNRPKWLANCLYQLSEQDVGDLTTEIVVVAEGSADFENIISRFPARYLFKEEQGFCGAYAKDYGISHAWGKYCAFCDDDNIYYSNALRDLYAVASGHDIGIARAVIMGLSWRVIPEEPVVRWANLDTMCLCVRRSLAMKARWSDHQGTGTDYAWVKKLLRFDPDINFGDAVVGEHLN